MCRLVVTATGFDERLVFAAQELASMHQPNAPTAGTSLPACVYLYSTCSGDVQCLCTVLCYSHLKAVADLLFGNSNIVEAVCLRWHS